MVSMLSCHTPYMYRNTNISLQYTGIHGYRYHPRNHRASGMITVNSGISRTPLSSHHTTHYSFRSALEVPTITPTPLPGETLHPQQKTSPPLPPVLSQACETALGYTRCKPPPICSRSNLLWLSFKHTTTSNSHRRRLLCATCPACAASRDLETRRPTAERIHTCSFNAAPGICVRLYTDVRVVSWADAKPASPKCLPFCLILRGHHERTHMPLVYPKQKFVPRCPASKAPPLPAQSRA